MKAALNALNKNLNKDFPDTELLGRQLEALHFTAMDYIAEKGVGMQSSKLGQDRMDFALDLCSMASDQMDFYASSKRKEQVREFERKTFGKEITQEGVLNFRMIEADLMDYKKANESPAKTNENVKANEIADRELEDDGFELTR